MNTLYIKSAAGFRKASQSEVCEAATTYVLAATNKTRVQLISPTKTREFLLHQAGIDHEQFGIVYLDKRYRLLRVEILFKGTVDGAAVYPREVMRRVLNENATAVIIFHNHPSGIAEPSGPDKAITQSIKDALALIDVRVVDHIIIGGTEMYSFAEKGDL